MPQTQLRKAFDKKDFQAGASPVKIILWYFTSTLFFKSGLIPFSTILVFMLRLFGARIGKDVRVKPYIHIRYPWKLILGDHSWLADCYIENLDQVTIGKNVCVSQQAMLMTGNHDYTSSSFDLIIKPIVLEDGVWIGARATVLPGVTAFSHSMLSASSTTSKNMNPYTIYQGVPAVPVRTRNIS